MANERRAPGLGVITGGVLLLGSLAAVGWWQFRPRPETGPAPSLADLDVVCLGRIDGEPRVRGEEPRIAGRVVDLPVKAGEHVAAGQILLRFDDSAFRLKQEEARAAADVAAVEVKVAELEARLHTGRVETQMGAVAAMADRVRTAQRSLADRKEQLNFERITPAEYAGFEAEVRQTEHLLAVEEAKVIELGKAEPDLKVQAAAARKAAADAALRQAEKAVADCVLKARTGGHVLRIQTAIGETVVPGSPQPPIVFREDGPLVVVGELDQEFLGRVRPGMRATVRDDQRADSPVWPGTVTAIGTWVARKRALVLEPGDLNDVRTVECIVTLDPPAAGLLVGQRVRVRIAKGE